MIIPLALTPISPRRTIAAAGCVRRKVLEMKRRLVTPLLVAAIMLVLGTAAGCDNGDDADVEDGSTPPAVVAPDITPGDSGEVDTVDGESDEDLYALRAEAIALCPAEFIEECSESYISFATGSLETALCITPDGKWFMETPQGAIGDACSDPDGVIVAIVGGE